MGYKNIEDRRKYHKEYMRDYRKWLKEHHFCVSCKKQDAYTLNGRIQCFECNEKRRKTPTIFAISPPPQKEVKQRGTNGTCYICGEAVKKGSPTWDCHNRPFRVCEKHYEQLCQMGQKGREGRLRPLWGACGTQKSIKALEECKVRRLKLKQELENTERSTQTNGR